MRHPFQVQIVDSGSDSGSDSGPVVIPVANRSTAEKAEKQAAAIRTAVGEYNTGDGVEVRIIDLRRNPATVPA